jgi:hypothetical protein
MSAFKFCRIFVCFILAFSLSGIFCCYRTYPLPGDSLSVPDFVRLMTDLSEREGYFDSDNFVSNERGYLKILPDLRQQGVRGGVYLGVGPDQNYSYIACVRPRLAIIVDIRRQNALEHLYFKALFQLSPNRTHYLQRLFGRKIPNLPCAQGACGISELLRLINQSSPDRTFAADRIAEAVQAIQSWNAGLSAADFESIRFIAQTFVSQGPDLKFSSYNRAPRAHYPTYRQLLEETDSEGIQSNYLATEDSFLFIKKLHHENRILPIVGDLGGPSALLKTAQELRRRKMELTCFYVSNVEFYLFGSERWSVYLRNLASLPCAANACIIRSYPNMRQPYSRRIPGYYMSTIIQPLQAFLADESAGLNKRYWDLIERTERHWK